MLNPLTCPCPKCRTVVTFAPKTGPDTVQICPLCGESFLPQSAPGSAWADQSASSTLTLDPARTPAVAANASDNSSGTAVFSADPRATLDLASAPVPSNSAGTLTFEPPPGTSNPTATLPAQASRSGGSGSDMPAKVGRFELQRLLGEGSFGRVYLAHDPVLLRAIALKVAKTEGMRSPEMVKRFQQEAQSAAHLQHPHIVPVFDSGQDGSYYYIAAGFIAGTTLAHTMLQLPPGKTLPVRDAVQLVRKLAEALAYAHQQGVVHRDVKPANILVREDGEPLLADFGLASRAMGEQQPGQEESTAGTPEYMAPEQWEGQAVAASDQYSLGCVLFQLLTGELPFAAASAMHYRFLHLKQVPASPRKYRRGVSLDLEAISLQCLNKEPVKRYAGCQELANDLRRWLDGEPVEARRPGPTERMVKWARRRPFQAAFAASGVLALAILVFALFQYGRYQALEASQYLKENQRLKKADQDQKKIEQEWLTAKQLMAESKWLEARAQLMEALGSLHSQPDLQADQLETELKKNLQIVDEEIGQDEQRKQLRARHGQFQKLYEETLFHDLPSTGQDSTASRKLTQASAREALGLYGVAENAVTREQLIERLEQHRSLLDPDAFTQLKEAWYELLLILAEVEAAPDAGQEETNEQTQQRAKQALNRLDRAAVVGNAFDITTQAYHKRRAHYQAILSGKPLGPFDDAPQTPSQPKGTLDWFLRAIDRYRADDLEQARLACGEVLHRQEKHFWARYLRGLCSLQGRRWLEAHSDLTICLNQKPHPWPRLLRGFASCELGYQERRGIDPVALRMIGIIVTSGPGPESSFLALAPAAHLLTRSRPGDTQFADARADFDSALATKGLETTALYMARVNRGVLFIRQERWPEAIEDLEQAVQVLPKAFQAHVNLAQALQGTGRPRDALAAVSTAIELEPKQPELYLARARLHLVLMNWASARKDLEQVVAREPRINPSQRLVESLVELGHLLAREGDDRGALQRFDEALRLRPDFVLTQRFRYQALLAQDRRKEAAEALDQYLAFNRNAPATLYQARGLLHAQAGELPQAIELYTLALDRNPRDVKTRGHRGWVYIQLNAPQAALEDFKACLRDQPDSAEYLTGRAAALVRLRQPGALADAAAAQAKGSLTDPLLYQLSCVYALSAMQIVSEKRSLRDYDSVNQARQYEGEALWLLRRTMEKLPPERREKFWRDQVEADPALSRLRGRREYGELTGLFK